MSYSFWNVYRWELELGGGGQLDYYSHPKWVLCLLLSENILLAFLLTSSTICPWTLQLIAISISLSLFVLTTLWVMRHLASSIVYCLACSDVSLRDVCVCVPCQMKLGILWGQGQICFMFHLILNDGNKKWRHRMKAILKLESDYLDQFLTSHMTLNKTLKLWAFAVSSRKWGY